MQRELLRIQLVIFTVKIIANGNRLIDNLRQKWLTNYWTFSCPFLRRGDGSNLITLVIL